MARQSAALDQLTVIRLRTECRIRRLPVSGRKRNLVRRLLPYADVILGETSVAGSDQVTNERVPIDDGHVAQGNDENRSRDFCGKDCNVDVGGWCDRPQLTTLAENNNSNITRLCINNNIIDTAAMCKNGRSSLPIKSEVEIGAATWLKSAATTPILGGGSGGSLSDCWLRQQRVIETLRRQLVKYRVALDRAKYSAAGLGDESHVTADEEFPFLVSATDSRTAAMKFFGESDGGEWSTSIVTSQQQQH